MIALTIGTWSPLHRSPLQHSTSHLVIFPAGENFLQFFSLHSDEVAHPLTKTCHAWALSFDISFATTVLTVQTGYLFCVVFAVIPALKRETFVTFQGITWKKKQKYYEPVPEEGWHTELSYQKVIFLFLLSSCEEGNRMVRSVTMQMLMTVKRCNFVQEAF